MKRDTGRVHARSRRRVGANAAPYSTRRAFILAAAAWPALAWARAVLAQSKQAPVLIGWLTARSRKSNESEFTAFKEGLAALGWKSPQIAIEERWADGYYDRLPLLAKELAAKRPAVIVAAGGQSIAAAAKAAPGIPIVMATSTDPVSAGFAASLARPGGMITGLSNLTVDVTEKLLELLLVAAPKLKRIGFLFNSGNVNYAAQMNAAQRSIVRHSVEARFADVARPEEIDTAISRLATEGVQALVVTSSSLLIVERRRIVKLALARHWPVITGSREFAEEGALLTYGSDPSANFRRAAYFVDRVIKGAKPGELPIEQPTNLELVINRKTATALKLNISQELLLRADKVIE